MKKLLKYFRENRKLPEWYKFKGIDEGLENNICFLKATRGKINDKFKLGDSFMIGDKVRLISNDYKNKGFVSGMIFKIESIGELINGIFKSIDLEYAYCLTT